MFFSVSHTAFASCLGINSHLVPLVVSTDTIRLYVYKEYIDVSAAVNLSCVMSTTNSTSHVDIAYVQTPPCHFLFYDEDSYPSIP
jgi:hypothetical protein